MATQKKRPTKRGALEILDRVAGADALLRGVAAGLHVGADGLALARPARDQVVGVGDLDSGHRPPDRSVVEEAQILVAGFGDQRVRLIDLDLAAISSENSRPVCQGSCHSSRPSKCAKQKVSDPGIEDLLGDRHLPVGLQPPVSRVFSRSIPIAQPASKM